MWRQLLPALPACLARRPSNQALNYQSSQFSNSFLTSLTIPPISRIRLCPNNLCVSVTLRAKKILFDIVF